MSEKFTWLNAFKALDEIETETVTLKEGFKANIADTDDMTKAKEVLDTKEDEPIATVVDPSTTVADDLKAPNPGDVIFCCPDCKTFFYHTSDDVNKSDKVFVGEDGEEASYYNIGLACPHCGQTEDGFKLVGQVSAFNDKKEETAQEPAEEDVADWDSLLKTEEPTIEPTEDDTQLAKGSEEDYSEEPLKEELTEDDGECKECKEACLSQVLSDLIKDEWEAIDGYKKSIATFKSKNADPNINKVFEDIIAEEMKHIGQLEATLGTIASETSNIETGKKEGAEQLEGNAVDIPVEDKSLTESVSDDSDEDDTDQSEDIIDTVLNKAQVEKLLEVLDYGTWISEMGFDDHEEEMWTEARNSKWILTNNLSTELVALEPEDGTYCEEGMVLVFNEDALFDVIERSQAEKVLEAEDQDDIQGDDTFLESLDKTHWTIAKDGTLYIEANLPAKLGVVSADDVSFPTVTKEDIEANTADGGDMEANLDGFDLRDENWAVFDREDERYQALVNKIQATETPANPNDIPDQEEPENTQEIRIESVGEAMEILRRAPIKQSAVVINNIVDKRFNLEGRSFKEDMPWFLPMSQFRYFYENILPEWTEEHPSWGDLQEQMATEYEEQFGKKFDIDEIIEENECFETCTSPIFYSPANGGIDQFGVFERAFETDATVQDELDDVIIEEVNAFMREPNRYNIDNETIFEKEVKLNNPDVYLESFNEASFEELANKYLTKTYANIDSFKTTQGVLDESRLVIDGTITFKSGKTQDSRFIFERCNKKANHIKFSGLNETFTRAKKPFTLIAEAKDNELVFRQLNYNYVVSESLIAKDSVKTADFLIESNKRKANKKSK